MILAPATMAAEKEPKEAARKCLEEVGLDPDSYRVGHTKARGTTPCRCPFMSSTLYFIVVLLACYHHIQVDEVQCPVIFFYFLNSIRMSSN